MDCIFIYSCLILSSRSLLSASLLPIKHFVTYVLKSGIYFKFAGLLAHVLCVGENYGQTIRQ